jgi:hypothetical protein
MELPIMTGLPTTWFLIVLGGVMLVLAAYALVTVLMAVLVYGRNKFLRPKIREGWTPPRHHPVPGKAGLYSSSERGI